MTEGEIKDGVESFLIRYDKTLNGKQVGMILADLEDTGETFLIRIYILIKKIFQGMIIYSYLIFIGHPLYLRIILDEVRVFGVYEKLDEELFALLSTNGVIELYTLIIKRWQLKFDRKGEYWFHIS